MDDSYILARTKEELEEILIKISHICDMDQIVINKLKTKICPIEKGFTFLKCKYSLFKSGFTMKIAGRASAARQRSKLRKFKEFYRNSEMTLFDICHQYKAWRNFILKDFHAYKLIQRMDTYFYNIFNFGYNEHIKPIISMRLLESQRL